MVSIQRILKSQILSNLLNIATLIATLTFLILSALGSLTKLSSFLAEHLITIFSIFILSALFYLYLEILRLKRRITIAFRDNFKHDFENNWEYKGQWSQPEKGVLRVRGGEEGSRGDEGGITKVGALWENYEFSFETKIINKVTGWIVRARDSNNYFMFQCGHQVITPHQRLSRPLFKPKPDSTSVEITGHQVGWKILDAVPHNKKLHDWFKVKIIVRGSSVQININDEPVFHQKNLLTIPVGRVGFRCWGDEEAHFRKVRVKLID